MDFGLLRNEIEGDVYTDDVNRKIYSTDASAYKELPIAVVRPKTKNDIKRLISFAAENKVGLIPRTAGTSLAGQVVGGGIIVDVSKYFTRLIEVNPKERWVKLEPGVVLDELNKLLKPHDLLFAPETSTSNRCMIGGMVGNNSCGAHSLVYGSTRDHLLEIEGFLSDGSEVVFKTTSTEEFFMKTKLQNLEGEIYRNIHHTLSDNFFREEIKKQYPDKRNKRRNTGYALDILADMQPFNAKGDPFNFCKLIAGSEGTLVFITAIKLSLEPLPPPENALVCAHFETLEEAYKANLIALKHQPVAIELMDKIILDCTKANIEQRKNRFFIEGDPGAILCIEFVSESKDEILDIRNKLVQDFKKAGYGYHFPVVFGDDINRVWALRKAGLGLLSNIPGDAKPAPVIEDTAVNPEVLPEYIEEFNAVLEKHHLSCVYYAHIGTGELHLRPVLNLKDPRDIALFYTIAYEVAKLVKKYKGSLSGEHGDGRLRGEFIPLMLGDKVYEKLRELKYTWDPDGIFNPGKIVDTPRMNTSLRYEPGQEIREIKSYFRFDESGGVMRMAEKCNGSGDCRKSAVIGGTMCPSYQATKDEDTTTRARANLLREFLTNSKKLNPFDHKEIYDILDLCLSCKGCKSECPSNVDMAKLKAEFLQHYYESNHIPLRTRIIANIHKINALASVFPDLYNATINNPVLSGMVKKTIGFAALRSMPALHKQTLKKWLKMNLRRLNDSNTDKKGKVYLFIDEFTNYNDTDIGITTVKLLSKLGYEIHYVNHLVSGRAYLSKGLLKK
ncbi:MAG: FAD-binding and (Fe-S)-binding domain-containing protein, partial [Bacteroidota bacterium]